jgi:sialic acid synthase SpsE
VGTAAIVAAMALGANIIEKSVTFDKSFHGPENIFSIEPSGLPDMVELIRFNEKALGSPV